MALASSSDQVIVATSTDAGAGLPSRPVIPARVTVRVTSGSSASALGSSKAAVNSTLPFASVLSVRVLDSFTPPSAVSVIDISTSASATGSPSPSASSTNWRVMATVVPNGTVEAAASLDCLIEALAFVTATPTMAASVSSVSNLSPMSPVHAQIHLVFPGQ